MAGLDPAIHVFAQMKGVDARDERGHHRLLVPDFVGTS
jgi:hypothetical protein